MTRLKRRKFDRIRAIFGAIDKTFVDRSDLYDSAKIKELENKMDENLFDGKNQFDKIGQGKFFGTSNKRMKIKNSKRY